MVVPEKHWQYRADECLHVLLTRALGGKGLNRVLPWRARSYSSPGQGIREGWPEGCHRGRC